MNPSIERKSNSVNAEKSTWWINAVFVLFIHIVSVITFWVYPPSTVPIYTWILVYACWQLATLGITTGYHRLWSHRSFEASTSVKILLAWMGTLGFQGSIKWWVLRHRLHHRFTDTDQDPYNAKQGLWFSHMGWIFAKPKYTKMQLIDAQDLLADPIVRFQHRYFVPLALFNSILLPALIAHFGWNDFWGGLLYAGYVCRVMIWHVTFCINSLAHWIGEQEYSTAHTARGHIFLLALLTNGEGYHNFHHEFPSDYRNGVNWWDWDPTKWFIFGLYKLGLVWELKWNKAERIAKARLITTGKWKENSNAKDDADGQEWMDIRKSELMNAEHEFYDSWLVIDGFVLDLRQFLDDRKTSETHPGGRKILKRWVGRDATKSFYGGLNIHTQAAITWMTEMRVGRFVDDLKLMGVEMAAIKDANSTTDDDDEEEEREKERQEEKKKQL